jgi:hypothetical protein
MTSLARLAPAAAAAILLTAGIVTLALLTTNADESAFVHLRGVPDSLVDGSQGETIEPAPADASPVISSNAAISRSAHLYPGVVRQVVLVKLTQNWRDPPERLVWAVSLRPGTFPQAPLLGCERDCPSLGPTYAVVFVDAAGGESMESSEGGLSGD